MADVNVEERRGILISTRKLNQRVFKPLQRFIVIIGGLIFGYYLSLNDTYNNFFRAVINSFSHMDKDDELVIFVESAIILIKYVIGVYCFNILLNVIRYLEGRQKFHMMMVLQGYYLQAGEMDEQWNDIYMIRDPAIEVKPEEGVAEAIEERIEERAEVRVEVRAEERAEVRAEVRAEESAEVRFQKRVEKQMKPKVPTPAIEPQPGTSFAPIQESPESRYLSMGEDDIIIDPCQ